jgi:hypothetical protein
MFTGFWVGASLHSGRRFTITVSSNEAQHTLIQKSLSQQVLVAISRAG